MAKIKFQMTPESRTESPEHILGAVTSFLLDIKSTYAGESKAVEALEAFETMVQTAFYEDPKKLVPHWPALYIDEDWEDSKIYDTTSNVFHSEDQAKDWLEPEYKFIRLLKDEREPIMLEADEVRG